MKYPLLLFAISILTGTPSKIISTALLTFLGIFNVAAKSQAVPEGIYPILGVYFETAIPLIHSCKVPSPPEITRRSYLSSHACFANNIACFDLFVATTSILYPASLNLETT